MGQHVIRMARSEHAVSAFLRDPARANFSSDVQIIQGDAFRPDTILAAVPGHDAVISCLGGKPFRSFGPKGKPGAAAAPPLVETMMVAGICRLIVVSAMGAVDRSAVTPVFRLAITTILRGIYADKDAMEPIITASALDWTIVRAANLNNKPEGPVDDAPRLPLGMRSFVPRSSVASYMLRIINQPSTFRRIVFLTSRRCARDILRARAAGTHEEGGSSARTSRVGR